MCIVSQKNLSTDDLAFLTGCNLMIYAPDEEAINRSLSIHEEEAEFVYPGPVCLSQLVEVGGT